MLNLKLTKAQHLLVRENSREAENRRLEQLDLLDIVDDGDFHVVKITTNSLDLKKDKFDDRLINAINNVKLIYMMEDGGCLILIGNLSCSFKEPYGGEFYVRKVVIDENNVFDDIVGVKEEVKFSNYPESIDSMQPKLKSISLNPDLVFNLSQFDEFMEIFEFYKALSSELNNNAHYIVDSISKPYYFVPIEQKAIEVEDEFEISDQNHIVTGHKLEDYKYESLSSELQDCVLRLIDVKIKAGITDIKKIKGFSDSLYLSNESEINEKNDRNLNSFDLKNIIAEDSCLILSGEAKNM